MRFQKARAVTRWPSPSEKVGMRPGSEQNPEWSVARDDAQGYEVGNKKFNN
jgi:hypothetical protein